MVAKSLAFVGLLLLLLSLSGFLFLALAAVPDPLPPHNVTVTLLPTEPPLEQQALGAVTPTLPPVIVATIEPGATTPGSSPETATPQANAPAPTPTPEVQVHPQVPPTTPQYQYSPPYYAYLAPPPPPQSFAPGCRVYHAVVPGDTLFSIARRYAVDLSALMRSNGLFNTTLIYPNQTLCIPGASAIVARAPSSTSIPSLNVLGSHVVRPGEALACIGRAYKIMPDVLAAANGLNYVQPLAPGAVLQIPDAPWINMTPGPICQPQFTPAIAPAPAPLASVPIFRTASGTPELVAAQSNMQAPAPTPAPIIQVEVEFPQKMWTEVTDFARLSLIRATLPDYQPTTVAPNRQTVVGTPRPAPIGTPHQPLEKAFGPTYAACATAYLTSKAFDPKLTSLECQSMEQNQADWEWSISTSLAGTQYLHFTVVIKWLSRDGKEEIQQEIWHYRGQVEVVRPIVVAGQLAVLPIVGTLIAAFLSFPYVSESWKARQGRLKEGKTSPPDK